MAQSHGNEALDSFVTDLLLQLRSLSVADRAATPHSHTTQPSLPPDARPYILTLHVLYPHVLLDALDLLDRGLVTRLCVHNDALEQSAPTGDRDDFNATLRQAILDEMDADDAARARDDARAEQSQATPPSLDQAAQGPSVVPPRTPHKVIHNVRSAQVPHHRQHGAAPDPPASSQSYQVHLRAWHCSCPAFALAAFAPGPPPSPPTASSLPAALHSDAAGLARPDLPDTLCFGFGGLPALRRRRTHTGPPDAATLPPACKHLMACVLAEAAPRLFAQDAGGGRPTHERARGTKGVVERWIDPAEAAGWAVGAADA